MICNKRKYFTVPEVLVAPQNSMLLLIQKSTPACFDDEKKYHILTFYHHHWVVAAAKGSGDDNVFQNTHLLLAKEGTNWVFVLLFLCGEGRENTSQ